jgi:hypothetical protein
LVRKKRRPVSDVAYTGLTDTATGFSGSSTLDSSVEIGSALPLVLHTHNRNAPGATARQLTTSSYDLWDTPDSSASLQLSGVSDPPFASAALSTPYPQAHVPSPSISNALIGFGKFGSGMATLLGQHPITQTSAPSVVHGARAKAVPVAAVPSGHFTLAVVVICLALGLLLLNGSPGDLI